MINPWKFFLSKDSNSLPIDFFIGDKQLNKLKAFCKNATLEIDYHNSQPVARLAPSVVTRGEVQLFNIDIPRFSVRVYLSDDRGFINLRRMAEVITRLKGEKWLKTQAKTKEAYREPGLVHTYYSIDEPLPSLQDLFKRFERRGRHNIIADCLLTAPPSLLKSHTFVTADLGWAYGEGRRWNAIPYVSAISGFSGGACAQACAFMVAALLQDYPPASRNNAGIHGLAEITAMTTPPEYDLVMKGLYPAVLAEYFVRAGRSVFSYREYPTPDSLSIIAVHVRSGFAPILYVKKMDNPPTKDKFNHVVVAVGVSNRMPPLLVVNDPAEPPFQNWNLQTYEHECLAPALRPATLCVLPNKVKCPLTEARSYFFKTPIEIGYSIVRGVRELADIMERSQSRNPDHHPIIGSRLSDFSLIQILLKDAAGTFVDFPIALSDELTDEDAGQLKHDWERCDDLQALASRWCWVQKSRDRQGMFVRVNIWDAEAFPPAHDSRLSPTECKAYLLLSIERDKKSKGNRWRVSTDFNSTPVRIPRSDAAYTRPDREDEPHTNSGSSRPVRQVIGKVPTSANSSHSNEPSSQSNLSKSLITSFSATDLSLALDKDWPQDIDYAELYAFMHCDLQLFGDTLSFDNPPENLPSISERLASMYVGPRDRLLAGNGDLPSEGAPAEDEILGKLFRQEALAKTITKLTKNAGVIIRSVATYMPQLYSENVHRALEARQALCTIAQLRQRLNDNDVHKHDIRTIEMSAGSRVRGLSPWMSNEKRSDFFRQQQNVNPGTPVDISRYLTLFTSLRTQEQSLDVLIGRLKSLCKTMRLILKKGDIEDLGFSLALEIEPGPLFVLNSRDAVKAAAQRIANAKELSGVVGINVDIAHCILAGLTPEDIFDRDVVENRICHFHISDHGLGHFGDAPIGDCGFGEWCRDRLGRLKLLREWVRKASEFTEKRGPDSGRPPFSGVISVELEAARDTYQVQRSVDGLGELLLQRQVTDGVLYSFLESAPWFSKMKSLFRRMFGSRQSE